MPLTDRIAEIKARAERPNYDAGDPGKSIRDVPALVEALEFAITAIRALAYGQDVIRDATLAAIEERLK